jgi:hypothetical protein
MHWQDIVLTIGQIIFIIALIPAVKHKHKPPFSTSVLNGIVLFCFVIVYLSLSLWFAAITTAVVGVLWLTLAMQKKAEIS